MMLKGFQRLIFTYFILKISFNSFALLLSILFLSIGLVFGSYSWIHFGSIGEFSNGIIMIVSINLLIGAFYFVTF